MAQLVRNPPAMQEPWLDSWVRKIHWRKERLPTAVFLGFPCASAGNESTHNEGDLGSILGMGRSPGEGKGYPLQYSGLENSMDCVVHGVTKSRTLLSNFHFHFVSITQGLKMKTSGMVSTTRPNKNNVNFIKTLQCSWDLRSC